MNKSFCGFYQDHVRALNVRLVAMIMILETGESSMRKFIYSLLAVMVVLTLIYMFFITTS